MNELALFTGAGGGILGGFLLGWRTRVAVEINPFCRSVLLQRQREGTLPKFPIWDDVRTFDGRPFRGHIDVISGGFPCQDISAAGRGEGLAGARSGLWAEYARIIGEVCPEWCLIENSPLLRTRGLVRVLKDLARLGYDARWGVLGAAHVSAPHRRNRMWIVAHAHSHTVRVQQGGAAGRVGTPRMSLETMARTGNWPTPMAHDVVGDSPGERKRHSPSLPSVVLTAAGLPPNGGQLNLDWRDWLMGWPIGWSGLAPLETGRFRQWLDLHGKHSQKDSK